MTGDRPNDKQQTQCEGARTGLVDIHSHVLPGLDDGPRTLEQALAMCELYAAEGVSTVVATPHLCHPRFRVSRDQVLSGARALSEACRGRGLDVHVLPGADVRLHPELLSELDEGRLLTLGDAGTHLLLELPTETVPHIEGLAFQLAIRGVVPVLSHPERNLELARKPERLAGLVEAGCRAQVTSGSLLGHFGRRARHAAEVFLKAGLVHAVATDAHAPGGRRRPVLRAAAKRLEALVGRETATALLREGPAEMIGPANCAPMGSCAPHGGEALGARMEHH